jgi:hypothetical protein
MSRRFGAQAPAPAKPKTDSSFFRKQERPAKVAPTPTPAPAATPAPAESKKKDDKKSVKEEKGKSAPPAAVAAPAAAADGEKDTKGEDEDGGEDSNYVSIALVVEYCSGHPSPPLPARFSGAATRTNQLMGLMDGSVRYAVRVL